MYYQALHHMICVPPVQLECYITCEHIFPAAISSASVFHVVEPDRYPTDAENILCKTVIFS